MIRIQVENTTIKVFFPTGRIGSSDVKALFSLGNRMAKQNKVNLLFIEVGVAVRIERSALKLIQNTFNKLNLSILIFVFK